jgi:hypothetical protein
LWPGVDVAISDWPDRAEYEARVDCALANSVQYTQADSPADWDLTNLTVRLESNAGHRFPSGAAQDRRIWLEIVGYDSQGVERCSLGKVPDDVAVAGFEDERACDPNGFWLFRDRIFDKDGEETHMFWRADPSVVDGGFISNTLPFARPFMGTPEPHFVENKFQVSNSIHGVTRITLRVRSRPMDFDVLEELIEKDLLDPAVKDEIRTVTIPGTEAELRLTDTGLPGELVLTGDENLNCREFECAFHPDAPGCR